MRTHKGQTNLLMGRVVRAGGTLKAGQSDPQDDPIAEVLRELREERAAAIESLADDCDRAER